MKEQKTNASYKSVYPPILGETSHNSNLSQKSIDLQVEVPSSTPHYPQSRYSPTAYDYLTLIPVLLTAVTPLVLGWLDRQNRNEKRHR
jgi:hypothetical protein